MAMENEVEEKNSKQKEKNVLKENKTNKNTFCSAFLSLNVTTFETKTNNANEKILVYRNTLYIRRVLPHMNIWNVRTWNTLHYMMMHDDFLISHKYFPGIFRADFSISNGSTTILKMLVFFIFSLFAFDSYESNKAMYLTRAKITKWIKLKKKTKMKTTDQIIINLEYKNKIYSKLRIFVSRKCTKTYTIWLIAK